jgi:hypothetical protein
MAEHWLTREQLHDLTGWAQRTIQVKVQGGALAARASDRRERNGRPIMLYALSTLPADLQLGYLKEKSFQAEVPPSPSPSTSLVHSARTGDFEPKGEAPQIFVSGERLNQSEANYKALRILIEYRQADPKRRARFVDERGLPFASIAKVAEFVARQTGKSVPTIFRMLSRFKTGGVPALARLTRSDKGSSHWFEAHPEAKHIVAAEYLNPGMTAQQAYDALARWWKGLGRDMSLLPHYATVNSFLLSDELPAAIKCLARDGEQVHNQDMMPYLRRDYRDVVANQIWESDHMLHDVIVRNDCFLGVDKDAQMRLRLTCWMDMRTRKVVGFCWTPEGSSRSILTAYRRASLQWGDPLQVLTDNGKDYIKATDGSRKFARAKAVSSWQDDIELLAKGALHRLGVQVQHCLPYHPQSKSIERFFRTLHGRFDSIFPHYTTGNAYNRPDQANDALKQHKKLLAFDRGDDSPLLPASEFIRMAAYWIENDYNNKKHRGVGMDGRSPNQLFDELYPADRRRRPNLEALDTLLWERTTPHKVDSCAVEFGGGSGERRRYIAADAESAAQMYLANRTDVIVCYDPYESERAIATTLDGVKLANLKQEQFTPHSELAGPHISESMQERHRLRKASKATTQEIKLTARSLGHVSAYDNLRQRALESLPVAVGDSIDRSRSMDSVMQLTSQRLPKMPRPDDAAVAPPSAAQIAQSALTMLKELHQR